MFVSLPQHNNNTYVRARSFKEDARIGRRRWGVAEDALNKKAALTQLAAAGDAVVHQIHSVRIHEFSHFSKVLESVT